MGTTGAHTVEGTLLTHTQPPHACTHTLVHMHTHIRMHTVGGGERREERGVKEGGGREGGGREGE